MSQTCRNCDNLSNEKDCCIRGIWKALPVHQAENNVGESCEEFTWNPVEERLHIKEKFIQSLEESEDLDGRITDMVNNNLDDLLL